MDYLTANTTLARRLYVASRGWKTSYCKRKLI